MVLFDVMYEPFGVVRTTKLIQDPGKGSLSEYVGMKENRSKLFEVSADLVEMFCRIVDDQPGGTPAWDVEKLFHAR